MDFPKTLAEARAQMKGHNCEECDQSSCSSHADFVPPAQEEAAKKLAAEEQAKLLATEKSVKVTIEIINKDSQKDTVVHDGFCMAGIILIEDDLSGNFKAMNMAAGAFSADRLEAIIQSLDSLQAELKKRKVEAMLSEIMRRIL